MAKIIDGKAISASMLDRVAVEVQNLKEKDIEVSLAVILVGEDPASQVYVRNKQRACEKIGIRSVTHTMPTETTQEELLSLIDKLNADPSVHGILCQLPLPRHLDEEQLLLRIDPKKDVDAFHPENVGKITIGNAKLLPCTPAGVMEMLRYENIDVTGKHCVVLGRSNIVGKPMALLLLAANGTVTVCHSKTPDLAAFTKQADILVSAVGKRGLVTGDMLKDGAVVIDVSINRDENGKLCGDCDFASCEAVASAITPVPGGVGPMTIAMLMQNTVTAAKTQNGLC